MLNEQLDPAALGVEFADRGRLQIPDFLLPEAAAALHECLDNQVKWSLAYIDGEKSVALRPEELARLVAQEKGELLQRINERALTDFQFLYNSYMMITAYKEKRDPDLVLHRVVEYLNSEAFLGFMRKLTGIDSIIKADAQATRYLPGHFLKRHNDMNVEQGREVAYVINLTRDWSPDWGGLLYFLDDDGSVIDTFEPKFNAISLFRVPASHCVSCVSPYATRPRYAITGWLMSGSANPSSTTLY